jgi:hypothetical protein
MSDPFANTTTVKNILQHVLSPKIVSDGSGGYTTKVDIVNVDTIQFSQSQCGIANGNTTSFIQVNNVYGLTAGSIVFAVNKRASGPTVIRVALDHAGNKFTMLLDGNSTTEDRFGWFIAKF